MKHRHLILTFILVVVLAASSAWSQKEEAQEGIMDLKSKGFSKRFQPPVRFDHYLHETILRCRVCHHDFNVFSDRNFGKAATI